MMYEVASRSRSLLCSSNDAATGKMLFQQDILIALDLPKRLAVASYLSEGDCKGTLPCQFHHYYNSKARSHYTSSERLGEYVCNGAR